MGGTVSLALTGLGLGIALASAPGPVQAVLLAEAMRGGIARGLRAMAGANLTFGVLLVGLALGLSIAPPTGVALRLLKVAGGAFLLWLALEGFRSRPDLDPAPARRWAPPAAARGALAVLLNPGGWLFLGTVALSLLSEATRQGGAGIGVLVALALSTGLALGDGGIVPFAGIGLRRASERSRRRLRQALATVLAALSVWLLVDGLTA
jgi:threonine/homoserine/homoserine lactone efflux protein